MKKITIAASLLLMSVSSQAVTIPTVPKTTYKNHLPRIGGNSSNNFSKSLSFEISESDIRSSFAIDSSDYDDIYGKPTSKLEYEVNAARYLKAAFSGKKKRDSFAVEGELLIGYGNGLNRDYDWLSESFTQEYFNSRETLFSGTESDLTDIEGFGLTLSHNYQFATGGPLSLSFIQSIQLDYNNYTASGLTLTTERYNYYLNFDENDTIIPYSEEVLGYEDYFLSYSLGLKANYRVGSNFRTFLSGSYTPLGIYSGIDIHHQREDLKQDPSSLMGGYDVEGHNYEAGIEFTLPKRRNEPSISLFAKAFYQERTAEYTKDSVMMRFTDTDVKLNLYEATRSRKGISVGFKYIF